MMYGSKKMGYHNSGSGPMNYSAGMDMTTTNKRNMNMIGRMKTKSVPMGIGRGVMPKLTGIPSMAQGTKKGSVNYTTEMTNAKKKNVNGYDGKGKVMSDYNPMSNESEMVGARGMSNMLKGY